MKIGFTGTQRGMSGPQEQALEAWLQERVVTEVHHGDCIGADMQFHELVTYYPAFIYVHLPTNSAKRAYCAGNKVLPAKEYLVRNHDIVDACDTLLAAPGEMEEVLRSGTWATVRYAKRVGKPVVMFWPDGSVTTC